MRVLVVAGLSARPQPAARNARLPAGAARIERVPLHAGASAAPRLTQGRTEHEGLRDEAAASSASNATNRTQ
jgi:hypothetical protein